MRIYCQGTRMVLNFNGRIHGKILIAQKKGKGKNILDAKWSLVEKRCH